MNDEEINEEVDEEVDFEEELEKYKKSYRRHHWFMTIILLIVVSCFVSEFTQIEYIRRHGLITKEKAQESGMQNINTIASNLKNFRTVIDECYLGEIDENKMMEETIKGYVNGLDDEYSEYMTADEWSDFWESAFGNFVGIGVVMSVDSNSNIVVIGVVEDSPAEEAGIKDGDIIAEADGTNLLGETAELASSIIKGHEGTDVHLKIIRDNEVIEMDVGRREIELYKIKTKMLEDKIGYIQFQTFDEGSAEDLRVAYEELKAQGAKKIILDLRDNTGGVVEEAEKIADLFLDKGKATITTVDKDGKKETSYTEKEMIITEPVVILINEYSASASEMLASTLKDYNRAELVGKKTYGKGVMQSVIPLEDGSALKLTIAEYFTPSETKIDKVGISPDYEVDLDKDSEEDLQLNKAIEVIKNK